MKGKNKKIPKQAFFGEPDLLLFPQWFIDYANRIYKKLGMSKIKPYKIWENNER